MSDEKKIDPNELTSLSEYSFNSRKTSENLPTTEEMKDIFSFKTDFPQQDQKLTNVLHGLHIQGPEADVPSNKEDYGYTFFTRPQLNMTETNIMNDRILNNLLNPSSSSIQRYCRMMLDPRLETTSGGAITSDIIDNTNPFIPFLTNRIVSISGFQDIALPSYTTPTGLKKVQQSRPDGSVDIYDSFDLDVTFANMAEEPFTTLFYSWLRYMGLVNEGIINPYIDMIIGRVFDFNTRIYRIVLDEQKRYVKKLAMTGASFPINVPMGKSFDMSKNVSLHDQNKEINIRFKSDGMIYNDPIIVDDFNRLVSGFSPDMKSVNRGVNGDMIKIPLDLQTKMNYRALPRINPLNYEFEWWVHKSVLTLKDEK